MFFRDFSVFSKFGLGHVVIGHNLFNVLVGNVVGVAVIATA